MTYGPLGGSMVTFNHDARNRLTGGANFSYTYDALNNRVRIAETVSGNVYNTTFVTDPNEDLSQTLIKTEPNGTKTYYIYGLGLIGEEKEGFYRSYHYDFRGSTVALTDSDGDVTDRYSYGPYGELLTHTGTTSTPFLYNGRDGVMTDDNGLYFMRARYYNPEIKRFITKDEFEGRYDEILNTNLYEYANNNPVMNTDPEGEFVPLLIGAAYLAYRAWSAYDTYQDVRGAYQDYQAGNYGGLAERAVLIGAGIALGKVGKTGIKLARNTKMAGKVFKASKRLGKADTATDRVAGVRAAWKAELDMINRTGKGTRPWTKAEIKELKETGKIKGYEGHHINSVKDNPSMARDPRNVKFVKGRKYHLVEHGGNFRNQTSGNLIDR